MNNVNQEINNNINALPKANKNRLVLIILTIILLIIIGLLIINYFSSWQCVGGKWERNGLPLSKKPVVDCGNKVQELKNTQESKKANDTEANLVKPAEEIYSLPEMGIEITSPKVNEEIQSPLVVKGRVRTNWLFEGSFPVKILTSGKKVLAESYADTDDDWTEEKWVNFEGIVKFSAPSDAEGFIFLEPDDPSGLPHYGTGVHFPIRFTYNPEANNDTSRLFDKCGGYPPNERILGDCGEDCNTDNWKVYKNKKYGYSFRYPVDYNIVDNPKDCKASCIWATGGGDTVTLQGEKLENISSPMLVIRHLNNTQYNPPPPTATGEWIKEKFPWTSDCMPYDNIYFAGKDGKLFGGFDIFFPIKPQTYSRREIFYLWEGKIFQIEMLDLNTPQARQFYNIWLSTFQVVN